MKIRAAIFDIYNTLLGVGPGPGDAEARWYRFWQKHGQEKPPITLRYFGARAQELILAENEMARGRGVDSPEVYWPEIAARVIAELAALNSTDLDNFLYQHAKLERTVQLSPSASEVLSRLVQRQILLGLCSNCQPYTLRELSSALSDAGLSMQIFEPSLCFYSFEARFSKPAPEVFRRMERALVEAGIPIEEALMIGDRLDNDILPAKTRGWQSWHLSPTTTERPGGGWPELARAIVAPDISPL